MNTSPSDKRSAAPCFTGNLACLNHEISLERRINPRSVGDRSAKMRRRRYGELGVVFARTGVFLCLLLAGAMVRPRVSGIAAEMMLRNTGAAGEEVELNGRANLNALDEPSSQGRIILADQESGSDLGAKI